MSWDLKQAITEKIRNNVDASIDAVMKRESDHRLGNKIELKWDDQCSLRKAGIWCTVKVSHDYLKVESTEQDDGVNDGEWRWEIDDARKQIYLS